mmetsp:Transcript_1448/g.4394  ORF Transcript_1448/g.4394 Transcript_1448/m.4394 type:complete len:312 (-) Transcript_1448:57-992(-)
MAFAHRCWRCATAPRARIWSSPVDYRAMCRRDPVLSSCLVLTSPSTTLGSHGSWRRTHRRTCLAHAKCMACRLGPSKPQRPCVALHCCIAPASCICRRPANSNRATMLTTLHARGFSLARRLTRPSFATAGWSLRCPVASPGVWTSARSPVGGCWCCASAPSTRHRSASAIRRWSRPSACLWRRRHVTPGSCGSGCYQCHRRHRQNQGRRGVRRRFPRGSLRRFSSAWKRRQGLSLRGRRRRCAASAHQAACPAYSVAAATPTHGQSRLHEGKALGLSGRAPPSKYFSRCGLSPSPAILGRSCCPRFDANP